ncbi:hypothetical protein NHX12_026665 [Muraenolepis orangiensis]|uniref:Uncharacterized protein n=1 Tax=Muraenolepis orangiensis TaxID=630683 RepID=A0A9Q0IS33_9TELE|nr:hypothetical protein NHX12_026665 [Muraenolepis orangiensis]
MFLRPGVTLRVRETRGKDQENGGIKKKRPEMGDQKVNRKEASRMRTEQDQSGGTIRVQSPAAASQGHGPEFFISLILSIPPEVPASQAPPPSDVTVF